MDQTKSTIECGLSWITKFDKQNFIGKQTLSLQKEAGTK